MTEPLPGDFALTTIRGITGRAISAGQYLIGDAAPVQHAMVYVGRGDIVQAMPGGAELIPLEEASPVVAWSTGHFDLDWAQRAALTWHALALVGTPYSFLDFASLALERFHVRPRWVRDYVQSTGHLICSQLVDEVYRRAGVPLFDDGRIPGDVTPGDLWRLIK
ncbi:hypothetical protein OG436_29540 [Streptomyces caniferus]|uniref:hypothetical protein n=1 Tax=Streptomyces caniferus TaxID=285557 RepID=UPI002E2937B4|nr:hypothetical protein [Streptomyces caniferus]